MKGTEWRSRTVRFWALVMTGVVVVAFAAGFAAPVSAQTTYDPGGSGDAYYSDEEAMCYASGSGDGVLAFGDTITDDIRVPCYAQKDDLCKMRYVINLGDYWGGRIGGVRYHYPDAYHASGECGWGFYAGEVDNDYGLYMYLGNQSLIVGANQPATSVRTHLLVDEYTGTNCTGTPMGMRWDFTGCCGLSGSGYVDMWFGGIHWCGTPDTDPGDCHAKDVEWIYPTQTGTRSYHYRISSWVYDTDSCSSGESAEAYQEGCFWVNWVD